MEDPWPTLFKCTKQTSLRNKQLINPRHLSAVLLSDCPRGHQTLQGGGRRQRRGETHNEQATSRCVKNFNWQSTRVIFTSSRLSDAGVCVCVCDVLSRYDRSLYGAIYLVDIYWQSKSTRGGLNCFSTSVSTAAAELRVRD